MLLGLDNGPSPSSKAEPRAVVVRGSFQTPLTSRANPAEFQLELKTVTTVCSSHELFAFTSAESTGTSLFFFHFSHSSSWVILGQACHICETSKARGCAEVPQKELTLWGFHFGVLHFISCCKQCEMMALFPSCLAGAGSGFLLVMSFIFTLSKSAGWLVWFKSVLLHKCRILYGSNYCGLDKTFCSY